MNQALGKKPRIEDKHNGPGSTNAEESRYHRNEPGAPEVLLAVPPAVSPAPSPAAPQAPPVTPPAAHF